MSEDIVERLRRVADDGSDIAIDALAEIERLRAHNTALLALNDSFDKANRQHVKDLEEALRLMEPVAETIKAQDDDRLPDTCTVLTPIGTLRAIAAFVTRMKGEPSK